MPKELILVVDDEKDVRELVQYNLNKNGYKTICVGTGEDAVAKAKSELPNLIVLDLMLPGIDGLDVCRALKADARTKKIPIIMLTAKGEEVDIVTGLELGADDYVVKPFSPRVFIARIRAALRNKTGAPQDAEATVKHGELIIDPARHEVKIKETLVDLTYTEFSILHHLALHPGRVYTRNQIIDAIRGDDYPVTERAVDVQIVGLRKKLGKTGERIETVRGVGYRFRE
jgi:two-component system alkaline phosphatase synthesis response regulator PhoP